MQYVDTFHQLFQRSLSAVIYMTSLILRVTNFMKQTLSETQQSLSTSKKNSAFNGNRRVVAAITTPLCKPYEPNQIHPTSGTSLFNVTLPFKPASSSSLSLSLSRSPHSRTLYALQLCPYHKHWFDHPTNTPRINDAMQYGGEPSKDGNKLRKQEF